MFVSHLLSTPLCARNHFLKLCFLNRTTVPNFNYIFIKCFRHLKDRVAQLDLENTLLSKQLEATKIEQKEVSEISTKLKMDENLDIDGLKEKIISYQQLLKEAASKHKEQVDLSG